MLYFVPNLLRPSLSCLDSLSSVRLCVGVGVLHSSFINGGHKSPAHGTTSRPGVLYRLQSAMAYASFSFSFTFFFFNTKRLRRVLAFYIKSQGFTSRNRASDRSYHAIFYPDFKIGLFCFWIFGFLGKIFIMLDYFIFILWRWHFWDEYVCQV